jgi:S-adenosylmethionine hydrolase
MRIFLFIIVSLSLGRGIASAQSNALVLQSDFGVKDGAVSAMKGVAVGVSSHMPIFDLTHEIPAYNIWEAAYRLHQVASYWPSGTVFVSVVDPGVGSERRSSVLKTKSGHYFVSPDNGTFTLVAEFLGVDQVREIDESKNRRQNSTQSYTFHGRDVYAFTGARLAAGIISFEEVGPVVKGDIVRMPYQHAVLRHGEIRANIPVLDVQYGNVWSNIDSKLFQQLNISQGDIINVVILHNEHEIYKGNVPFVKTFSDVAEGSALGYMNSLLNFSLGINMGNFAEKFKVNSGPNWTVVIKKG